MNTHPSELFPAFVLDALDPADTHVVVVHIRECEQCREEVQAFRAVVDLLPYSATAHDPPLRVKRQLMARIEALQDHKVSVPLPASRPIFLPRGLVAATTTMSQVSMVLMLLLLVTAIGLGMVAMNMHTQLASVQSAMQLANQQAADQATVVQVLAAPSTHVHPLQAMAPAGTARMFAGPGERTMVLVVQGMPQLAQGETYQCWFASAEQQFRACTFGVNAQGDAELLVSAPQPIDTYSRLVVTRERNDTSTTPSNDVMFTTRNAE